ncbi:hypothetical protein DIPPA_02392 [Diplonema papillatum]|nr:hypothetical protein DIPPA_02392 [Diplonema papillatum]
MWLSSAELAVAARLRLGLPIAAECRLCGHGATDVIGSHAQTCFGSGRRTRLHNALRDIVADFARRGRDGTTVLLDVAVTYPLQLSQPHYATRAQRSQGAQQPRMLLPSRSVSTTGSSQMSRTRGSGERCR